MSSDYSLLEALAALARRQGISGHVHRQARIQDLQYHNSPKFSWNGGTPKSSMLVGCSLINHLFFGYPHNYGETHMKTRTHHPLLSCHARCWPAGSTCGSSRPGAKVNGCETSKISPYRKLFWKSHVNLMSEILCSYIWHIVLYIDHFEGRRFPEQS